MPRISLVAIVLAMLCSFAKAQPATAPSTQAVIELSPNSPVRAWFAELASPDALVRDKAQTQLMGMSREELWGLRSLIQRTRPLAPSQVAALHDIVIQVVLANESYDAAVPNKGFIGVRWQDNGSTAIGSAPARGIALDERLPGFPGYRWLRDGDVIRAVIIAPGTQMEQPRQISDADSLKGAVSSESVDKPLVLVVLRQGQEIRVPIRLSLLPKDLDRNAMNDPGPVTAFLASRLQRAEQCWQEQFAPLLRPDLS